MVTPSLLARSHHRLATVRVHDTVGSPFEQEIVDAGGIQPLTRMLESRDGLAVTGAAAACCHLAAGPPAVKASGCAGCCMRDRQILRVPLGVSQELPRSDVRQCACAQHPSAVDTTGVFPASCLSSELVYIELCCSEHGSLALDTE